MDAKHVLAGLGDWQARPGLLYRRLADGLRDAVGRGVFGAGSVLPAERTLARMLSVSRGTVIAAYRALRDEGLLESTRGSGTRVVAAGSHVGPSVPGVVLPESKLMEGPPPEVIDLSASGVIGVAGLSDAMVRLSVAEIRHLAGQFDYEPQGLPALRAAVAERYSGLGLPTEPDEVLITSGAQQALWLLFALFCRDGGTLVTENPTYAGALDAAAAERVAVLGLPTDEQGLKVSALRAAVRQEPVRLIYLAPSCQNPTGAVLSSARRDEITWLAAQAGVPVIDDMTLAGLAFDGRPVKPLVAARGGAVITVGSLSKLFWAGLRVGWIRASKELIARLGRLKVIADLGSSHLSQYLAARLVPVIDEAAAIRRQQLAGRRDLFSAELGALLPEWSWRRPAAGPFLFVRLPGVDADSFATMAERHGVRVLPGTRTATDDQFTEHLRLSFVRDESELRIATRRLRAAWTELSGTDRGSDQARRIS